MKRLGLFGGTFDPIHYGHLHIAHAFLAQLQLDSVIFLPAGDPYHKVQSYTPAEQRLEMVEWAIADEPHFAVSDVDMVREGATYTVDTVQIFRQHFPNTELWWLMGMDSLLRLHTWKNWQTLVHLTHIAVVARQGAAVQNVPVSLHQWLGESLNNGSLKLLNAPEYAVSSTQIRQAVQRGGDVSEWLPEKVVAYIREKQLYR